MSLARSILKLHPAGTMRAKVLSSLVNNPELLAIPQGLMGGGLGYLYNRYVSKDKDRRLRHILLGAGSGAVGGLLGGALIRRTASDPKFGRLLRAHARGDIDFNAVLEHAKQRGQMSASLLSRESPEALARGQESLMRAAQAKKILTPQGEQFRDQLSSMVGGGTEGLSKLLAAGVDAPSVLPQLASTVGLVLTSSAAPIALATDRYFTERERTS